MQKKIVEGMVEGTREYAERYCTENGTWWANPDVNSSSGWTNYTRCLKDGQNLNSHAMLAHHLVLLYTVGYSVSLASLIVAVIIMLYWRRLHCKSNTLHINLFLAFILRASMSFMKDRLFVAGLGLPQDVRQGSTHKLVFIQEGSHWECKTLYSLFMFAISASQTWMLMEGLYLYLLIHKTMATERLGVRPYVILGWALPWTFLIPWIVVKYNFENLYCWNIQKNPAYFWIMKGPWTAIVVFGKFVLVLIPLFGIMYIVLNVAFPSEVNSDGYNVVYLYVEMGYNSFQGFILALLFCFLNDEVHTELKRSWHQQRSRRQNSKILKQSWVKQNSRSSGCVPSPGQGRHVLDHPRLARGGSLLASDAHVRSSFHGFAGRGRPGLAKTLSLQTGPPLATSTVGERPRQDIPLQQTDGAGSARQHYVVITSKLNG
ncbi:hypothetical protein EGW08_020311 [Elysia chlorotica]|uniref:G-protein coupled receptors family 2 profile 2 domain-containing protein n=1 Tax=Elysia chlorotica TaxID=188477 RepID=A0A3S1H4B0_ELYCH|nr:hypothetical protein EGW08_020311 [Elysia chlorotica]